jgi:excisionase family DNA binding protein
VIEQALLAVQAVAKQLNVNARTVIRMIERGELPAFKISGMYRIGELDLEAYLERNRTQPKAEEK